MAHTHEAGYGNMIYDLAGELLYVQEESISVYLVAVPSDQDHDTWSWEGNIGGNLLALVYGGHEMNETVVLGSFSRFETQYQNKQITSRVNRPALPRLTRCHHGSSATGL